jgi:hypothetical protein
VFDLGAQMKHLVARRRLLVGALALSGLAFVLGPPALRLIRDFGGADALNETTRAAMVRMARLLYPHDAIPDDVYANVLDDALTSVAGDPTFADTLSAAEDALNTQQPQSFVDLDESPQLAAMRAVESEPFFATIQEAVRSRLYNHPDLWAVIGYEGPSFEKGGYLNRGAGVVDWLPEVR